MEPVRKQAQSHRQSSSDLQESSRNSDAEAKPSKDGPGISVAKTARENGARVSVNGGENILDNGSNAKVVGTKVPAAMGVNSDVNIGGNEGGLEDSVLKGASSLLKMQKNESSKQLGTVLDESEKRKFDSGNGANLGNEMEEYDFGVGDFVWGKTTGHLWWPGRIYHPLDASNYAKEVKQGYEILVAYFGDGAFGWCDPSQLKPLGDNFVEMSTQSTSKKFVSSVEKAMDEIGRLVDLKMTCSCVPKDNLIGFGRTLVVNDGVKEGLLIPEGGLDKFSSALFEPARLLAELKDTAQGAKGTNMLEFAVLKSWLLSFYRAKGGHRLPYYYDPKPVPGLEDKSGDRTYDISDYVGEVRVQGPEEEYWISSARGGKYSQTSQNVDQNGHPVGKYQQTKQKSVNEIMEGGAGFGNKDCDPAEVVVNVGSGGKKRKYSVDVDDNEETMENLDYTKKGDGSANGNGNSQELLKEESFSRERKKSKYLSHPYVSVDRGLGKKSTGEGHKSDSSGVKTEARDRTIDPMVVKAVVNEVLSEVRSAALKPLHLKGTNSVDLVGQFCSAFRRFSDCSESSGEFGNHHERKRKVEVSDMDCSVKEQSQTEPNNSSPEFVSQQKKLRKSEATNLKQKEKQDATPLVKVTEKGNESNKEASGASLIVAFGPCSTLPKKSDLIEIYRKFGALDEKETEMFYTNRCARVVFLKRSEAEEACHVSQLCSPFTAATTTFSVRNVSEIKSRANKGISIHKPSAPTIEVGKTRGLPAAQQHSEKLTEELNFVKERLEKMALLIETSGGKISEDLKSRLELEVKVLLEEVSTMVKK